MRMWGSPVGAAVLVAALGAGATGCGQINMLKGKLAFKEANQLYAAQNYTAAAAKYEEVLAIGCSTGECQPVELAYSYFFLGSSYDNMYRPVRQGEPENDALLQKAVEYYQKAADLSPDEQYKTRALQYLVNLHAPDKLNTPHEAEPIVARLIAMDPNDTLNYFQLSKLYEDAGEFERSEEQLNRAREVRPDDPDVYAQFARFYQARGEFEKQMEALKLRADKMPQNPEAQYQIAATYWDKVCLPSRPQCAPFAASNNALRAAYIKEGQSAIDKALALREDYFDGLIYKGLLLRSESWLDGTSASRREALTREADSFQEKALEIQRRAREGGPGPAGE